MPKKVVPAEMVEVAVEMKEKKGKKEPMIKEEKKAPTGKKGGMTAMSPEVKEKLKQLIEKHKLDKSQAAKARMMCMRGETPEKAVKAAKA